MVDIVFGAAIPPVQNNRHKRDDQHRPAPQKKKMVKERRKNRVDRRQDVRDGIIVTLSNRPDRRRRPDRRKS
jgi:hypothetical protein